MNRSALSVVTVPDRPDVNPYQQLLRDALVRHGTRVSGLRYLTPRSAAETAEHADVVHLHWIEHVIGDPGPGPRRLPLLAARSGRLVLALRALRRLGVPVVWTIHNLRPHERRIRWLDSGLQRHVFRACDSAIVHSDYARTRVEKELGGRTPVAVVRHGNYEGVYPPERRSRAELRRALRLPQDAFVYLAFGLVREYKRLPEAIRAFRELHGDDLRFVVAGRPRSEELADALRTTAAGDPRVRLDLERIADEDVPAYHRAADAAVLAYREVFSSGALMLALTFGLPVVAPAGGAARETVGNPGLEEFEPGGLTGALERMRTGDRERRHATARAAAERRSWDVVAAETLAVYEASLASARRRRSAANG